MLIKKKHSKNNIFLEKLNKVKQQCRLKIQKLNKGLYRENSTVITQKKKLTITLRSYSVCQVKDINSSIVAIEKLINYLTYLCAKQLHTNNKLYPIGLILHSTKATKELNPIILGLFTSSYTNLLNYQSTLLFKNNKGANYNNSNSLKKILPAQQIKRVHNKQDFKRALRIEKDHSSFFFLKKLEEGRCFFKLSKKFSRCSAINRRLVHRRNSKKLFTLIRAPFVFKKTREQFSLQKISSHIVTTFANSAQKHLILQNLRLLKLPAELKVVSYN